MNTWKSNSAFHAVTVPSIFLLCFFKNSGGVVPTMQNEAGDVVDVYIPRKCSSSGRIIGAKDHAAVQLNVADVDEKTGRVTGKSTAYAVCGYLRAMGESDDSINGLCCRDNIAVGLADQN